MKWKEFLKPNWKKMSIFLFIPLVDFLALTFTSPIIGTHVFFGIVPGAFLFATIFPFSIVTSAFGIFGINIFYTPGIIANISVIAGILLTMLWWYILSCLIIFAWNKFRTKK